MKDLHLDVDTPEKVPKILREAAQRYRESTIELQGAWQDNNKAGIIWEKIATSLEAEASKIEKLIRPILLS